MSRKARFPEDELHSVFQELLEPMEELISRIASNLSPTFPASVAESISDGMRRAKAKSEPLY